MVFCTGQYCLRALERANIGIRLTALGVAAGTEHRQTKGSRRLQAARLMRTSGRTN
jgi:hypothetical protein